MMPTTNDINRWIAEKVMGWTVIEIGDRTFVPKDKSTEQVALWPDGSLVHWGVNAEIGDDYEPYHNDKQAREAMERLCADRNFEWHHILRSGMNYARIFDLNWKMVDGGNDTSFAAALVTAVYRASGGS